MSTGRLYVVRHGETQWSADGRHTGRTDVPLEPAGRDQARAAGRALEGTNFSLVLCSPLSRARETCELAGLGEAAETDPDLAEWDYGDYEGLTTAQIREEHPGWTLWAHGVEGGETSSEVGRRADRVVARAREAGGNVACFSHGHLLRVLAARWVGLPPVAGRVLALSAGSVSVLGWEREIPVVSSWNGQPAPSA